MMLESAGSSHPLLKKRFVVFCLAAAGVFLLLLLRLWHLQVIDHERYLQLSEKNRIRYIPIAAPRGPIYDHDGVLLVDNRPSFTVSALRPEVPDPEDLLPKLAGLLGQDPPILEKKWEEGRSLPRFRPIPLAEDVDRTVMETVQENSLNLPGVLVEVRPVRSYPQGNAAAHVLGYLGEITLQELRSPENSTYRGGDLIGKTGLEKKLESSLRGVEGERRVEVDVKGRELRQLRTQDALPGNKVTLTLRQNLLGAADRALGDQAGSVVLLSVKTGEILAMVSKPSFDPAHFARGISSDEWLNLTKNPRHPLENKAIQGQYPPGSTFKMAVALAALRSGVAGPGTTVDCTGSLEVGNREFRCWKERGHGLTDLKRALKESCDVWFYQVALDTGIEAIAAAARDLGLGARLGFPLEGEKSGLIPDREWKRARFGEPWYDGETVIAGIGQGFVLTTPLQLAVMAATIANGGKVMRPWLVERIENWDGETVFAGQPEILRSSGFESRHLALVRAALTAAVNEPHGTAFASRLDGVKMAGKTGTAQVVKLKEEKNKDIPLEEILYRFRDHALFVGYAPADDPEVAISVVVEHGGHGSSAAAPVARAVLARYFGLDLPAEGDIPAESD